MSESRADLCAAIFVFKNIKKLVIMSNVFRISVNDTIRGKAYSESGKLLASVYDSDFSSINAVYHVLNEKCSGWCQRIKCITIENLDKQSYATYNVVSGRLKKSLF